jgi:hypothetical protein
MGPPNRTKAREINCRFFKGAAVEYVGSDGKELLDLACVGISFAR